MGRTTSWQMDIQGRPIAKQYPDGSKTTYSYENTTSRLRQATDEKQQLTYFFYNSDNTVRLIGFANATVPTPTVSFTYDPDYERVTSMTDGAGITSYSYLPITGTATLGAGRLAGTTGPLPNETITYGYDELGRLIHRAINGVDSALAYDPAGRLMGTSNALGSFSYSYDGGSPRLLSETLPNGQTASASYGNLVQDLALQRITHQIGAIRLSEFLYTRDIPARRITAWSQQAATQSPDIYSFGYDAANQLVSATITNSGVPVNSFVYSYDAAANRLSEQVGPNTYPATFNALNQLTTTASAASRTNEWDAANRLTAVNAANRRTEFKYDGQNRLIGIRHLVNGSEVSNRLFVWSGRRIREERDTNGVVTKRFFPQGVQMVTGANAGTYYYTRDQLGSIRELTDASGNVRARYAYDPFGRGTKVAGDLEADFRFAGMFWSAEANLSLTHFRAYDAEQGRWLSRDPLEGAEVMAGPNLYAYVENDPISLTDPLGLEPGGGGEIMLRPRGDIQVWKPPPVWGELRELTLIEMWDHLELYGTEDELSQFLRGNRESLQDYFRAHRPARGIAFSDRAPTRSVPGFAAVGWEVIGAGFTVLTMTDCDTVEGILALVRQGKGGIANKYEDRQYKELKRLEGW